MIKEEPTIKEPSEKYIAAKKLMMDGIRTRKDLDGLVKNKFKIDEDPKVAAILDLVQNNVKSKYVRNQIITLIRDREEHYKDLIKAQRNKIAGEETKRHKIEKKVKKDKIDNSTLIASLDTMNKVVEQKDKRIEDLNKFSRPDILDIEGEDENE